MVALMSKSAATVALESTDVAGTLVWLREHPALKAPHHRPRSVVRTGMNDLDRILDGGVPAGAITELVAPRASAGRTSITMAVVTAATRRGEVVGWIDTDDSLDSRSLVAAGAILRRVLWVRPRGHDARRQALKAADLILAAGGFGVLVLDLLNASAASIPDATWVRLAHRLGGSRTSLIVLTSEVLAGTQAYMRLSCRNCRGSEIEVAVIKHRGSPPGGRAHIRLGAPVD